MSRYEDFIVKILKKDKIPFEREKRFSDLKSGKFRFDFYISQLNCVIEVQGEQHYKQVKKFQKTRKDFLMAQERDRQKISYCLANNLDIFCIPFWEIKSLKSIGDITQKKFKATTKWKNDNDWAQFNKK